MILYFTGTNNSKYIAEFIADKTGEDVFSINESIKKSYRSDNLSGRQTYIRNADVCVAHSENRRGMD